MFDLKNFICGLQCSWVKRFMICKDNWKLTLKEMGEGDLLKCHNSRIRNVGLCLENIIESFCTFRSSYSKYKNNYLDEGIFNFCYPGRNGLCFDTIFWCRLVAELWAGFANIKVGQSGNQQ